MAPLASLPGIASCIALAAFFLCSYARDTQCEKYLHKHIASAACSCSPVKCLTLRFYIHDLLKPESYSNASAIRVAGPGPENGSGSFFGGIAVFDDKITKTPDFNSIELGRARGIYVADAMDKTNSEISLLFPFTATLMKGRHKGSISFFGQDMIADPVREINVIGGTEDFRMARGTALIRTVKLSAGFYNAVLEVTVYLLV